MKALSSFLCGLLLAASVAGASPFRAEAEEEVRVREIAALLRCPVCQSESILDSQSGTAREMVTILREMIAEGRDRNEIVEHFRSRYGDFVLLYPPASGAGMAAWLIPVLLLGFGALAYALFLRRGRDASRKQRIEAASHPPLDEKRLEGLGTMTMTIIAFALCAAVLLLVVAPLFRRSANRPLGTGIEDDGPVRRWQDEKDRLIAQLRDNDLALAEGRIDATMHTTIASRLAQDAETALARLREARDALAPHAARETSRIGRWPTVLAGLAVIAAAWGAHLVASRGDIDLTASPHADGRIPLPEGQAGIPVGEDGAPDIGAMVARLEARVEAGDYTPQDISMLLRSYRALGREDEATAVLAKARQAHPGDVGLMLAQAELLIGDPRPESVAEAETVIAAALAAEPDLPEALWYRSLLLVRQGRTDAARAELDRLAPRVAGNPQAAEAVRGLRARLDLPPDHPAPPDR